MLTRALAAWSKIKAWLRVHSPRILQTLNPGATSEQVAQVEAALGHPLPMAMRCIYRWVLCGCLSECMSEEGNNSSAHDMHIGH